MAAITDMLLYQTSGSSMSLCVVLFATTKAGAHSGQTQLTRSQSKSSVGSMSVSHSGQGFATIPSPDSRLARTIQLLRGAPTLLQIRGDTRRSG